MISVADLLVDGRVPGNYFATTAYVKSDLELGLLENRRGNRLLAIPDHFIRSLYAGLDKETGQATRLVLMNCGRWWGKNFYARFCEEVSDYYGIPLADMPMAEFLQCLQQCWVTHGWGLFELDQTYQHRGFLVVKTWHSPFATHAPKMTRPVCFLDAGILAAFFSQLSGRTLGCVQISCESLGADCNRFLIGLPERLQPANEGVDQQVGHEAIMAKITA
jgi:uncharacterized protein